MAAVNPSSNGNNLPPIRRTLQNPASASNNPEPTTPAAPTGDSDSNSNTDTFVPSRSSGSKPANSRPLYAKSFWGRVGNFFKSMFKRYDSVDDMYWKPEKGGNSGSDYGDGSIEHLLWDSRSC